MCKSHEVGEVSGRGLGLTVYSLWYLWLVALGALLVRRPRGGAGQEGGATAGRGGAASAARSRASSTRQ